MSKQKKNFYVVIIGRKPGMYTTWDECRKQVDWFKGAKFKGFINEKNALNYQKQCGDKVDNVIYVAPDDQWDTAPDSSEDKIYISRKWIVSNLGLSKEQHDKLSSVT